MTEQQWDIFNAALSAGKVAIDALIVERQRGGRLSAHLNEWLDDIAKAKALMNELGREIDMACEAKI